MTLEPFDRDKFCTACGFGFASQDGVRASYRWCQGNCVLMTNRYNDVAVPGDEWRPHLHRMCQRCGFEWLTETASTSEYAGPSTESLFRE